MTQSSAREFHKEVCPVRCWVGWKERYKRGWWCWLACLQEWYAASSWGGYDLRVKPEGAGSTLKAAITQRGNVLLMALFYTSFVNLTWLRFMAREFYSRLLWAVELCKFWLRCPGLAADWVFRVYCPGRKYSTVLWCHRMLLWFLEWWSKELLATTT